MSDDELLTTGIIDQGEYNKRSNLKIQQQIGTFDAKSTRSIRAILSGTGTEEDKAYLSDIEKQVQELRTKIIK